MIVTRGDDLPPGLLASLESRSIETVLWGEPLEAFAQLVRWARDERSRGSWGLPHRRAALVIASRDRWGSLDQLLRATARHFPDVGVWMGTDELLLQVRPDSELRGSAPPSPPLRLAGTDAGDHAVADREARADRPGSSGSPGEPAEPDPDARRSPASPPTEPRPTDGTDEPPESSSRDTAVTPEEIEMLLRLFDEWDDSPDDGPSSSTAERPEGPRGPRS
ncbi:MAG: hypothetical protein U0572_02195 [Phycisphaerales bacterium]